MYSLEKMEQIIKDYVSVILHRHDMSPWRNSTNKKVCNKIIDKCMSDLQNKELLKVFDDESQIKYFVRQTILLLTLE